MSKSPMRLTVLHVVTGLADGGAERVLFNLCRNDFGATHIVAPLVSGGKYEAKLVESGIDVIPIGFDRGRFALGPFFRLVGVIQSAKPDVLQTWMPHGDLLGGIAGVLARARIILWGVHHSEMRKGDSNTVGFIFLRLLATLSHLIPLKVIYTSRTSRVIYESYGYSRKKGVIVSSGFDLAAFFPSKSRRDWLEVGGDRKPEVVTFGVLARNHPQKNLLGVIEAFAAATLRAPKVRLRMGGLGVDASSPELMEKIFTEGVHDVVELCGSQADSSKFFNSVDYLILGSSHGESFPNVLGEAMACGVPCITSSVGSSSEIVGSTGWTFPPGDSEGLIEAIVGASRESLEDRRLRSDASRKRIAMHFSAEKMIARYHEVYETERAKFKGFR